MNIRLQPNVLRWARERAGFSEEGLADKLKTKPDRIKGWERDGRLRFTQAEKLAKYTHTPFGFLFLPEPPEESLPIPDFRTVGDAPVLRPSPDLLETVQGMQRRQAWMRDFLIEEGEAPLSFVRSMTLDSDPDRLADDMRRVLGFAPGWAAEERTWTDTLMRLRQQIEAIGVLIVINGVVGNNTRRKLSTEEFRGFALCDDYAPLIFINGADSKGAQMFTMAHELAHLWLGEDGVSNFEALQPAPARVEWLCNAAAAEFLVPARELEASWEEAHQAQEPYQYLARRFKVSPLVAARRALDLQFATRDEFFAFYRDYLDDDRRKRGEEKGGHFWNTQNVRIGNRFGAAVVRAAKEGRLLYREAYRLTGLRGKTFDKFADSMGYPLK